MSKFYRFFKFNNDNTAVTLEGCTFTTDSAVTISSGGQTITAGGQTIVAGGQTITAGGQTVTAGDVKVVAGDIYGGTKVFFGGTTTAAPCLSAGTVAPTLFYGLGSIYVDTVTGLMYCQTATNAWSQFATPF